MMTLPLPCFIKQFQLYIPTQSEQILLYFSVTFSRPSFQSTVAGFCLIRSDKTTNHFESVFLLRSLDCEWFILTRLNVFLTLMKIRPHFFRNRGGSPSNSPRFHKKILSTCFCLSNESAECFLENVVKTLESRRDGVVFTSSPVLSDVKLYSVVVK